MYIKETILAFILSLAATLIVSLIGGLTAGLTGGLTLCLSVGLAGCLTVGLAGGLAGGVLGGVVGGFVFAVTIGLGLGLTRRLTGGLVLSFSGNIILSLVVGLAFSFLLSFNWRLVWSLAGGLIWGLFLSLGLIWGLAGGLILNLALRLLFYPFYYFYKMDFYHAPYLNYAAISLPIWRAKIRLCALALDDPDTAVKFVTFLRTYRPLQSKLADSIFHAAYAGRLCLSPLDPTPLANALFIENDTLKPSADWYSQRAAVESALVGYTHHNNIHLKQQSCQQVIDELNAFKQQTLLEKRSWRGYYLTAIEKWLTVAHEELGQLKLQALNLEPITANVYLSGDALNPTQHKAIFFGRNDLKDQFARSVLTATQMPMFLIQGQRRTGKTSLLNFLEPLLGAGFKVFKQDLQAAQFDSIPHWLADLQRGISRHILTPQPEPSPSDNWLHCWQAVQACLSQFVGGQYRLILAFDEYEAIHSLLQQDPAQGERLLAAMRSYSQQQNKVVLLFVGAALFSELEQPNWSRYFVQVQRFRVDYLHHDDAIRLITEPVKLSYPPAVCERMFDLTQGHPALLQLLCSKMVDIANSENRKAMHAADLDAVVQAVSSERETLAILIFWRDFCADPACKHTVKQLLNGEPVTPNAHLYRLEEHGFIVEKAGRWHLRVPLFEMWLKRFADRV